MTKGDKYEYNTNNREQYILEVVSFNDESVLFNTRYKYTDTKDSFNLDVKKDTLNRLIKANNIGLITYEL
jgi:hypothetical protein|tara:strand:+ start:4411 stop:4620 length:210 start_codon:yes stop_codon:yes gene_type:complete